MKRELISPSRPPSTAPLYSVSCGTFHFMERRSVPILQSDLVECGPLSSPDCGRCVPGDAFNASSCGLNASWATAEAAKQACEGAAKCTGVSRFGGNDTGLIGDTPAGKWEMRAGDWLRHA